jgi:hypothetical protein
MPSCRRTSIGREPRERAGPEIGGYGGIVIDFGNSGKSDPEEIWGTSMENLQLC